MQASKSIPLPLIFKACLILAAGLHLGILYGEDIAKPRKDETKAKAAFLEAYKVFAHPRCVNCHPAGDSPLQGEDSRPHESIRLRRGPDGHGVSTLKCGNCHQAENQPGSHIPP